MKIGILGGGQLGRMLALSGIPLGHQFRFWEPNQDAPASDVGEVLCAEFDNLDMAPEFLKGLDCITYEFENIPVALVTLLAATCPVFPQARSLEISQDRLSEKMIFKDLDITCAPFITINSLEDLARVSTSPFKLPALLKTRRLGYDGKGQENISSQRDLPAAWQALGESPAILEERISFDAELSLICAQGRFGEKVFYPLVENRHLNGILSSSRVPSKLVTPTLQAQAEAIATKLLNNLKHTGVLTIEFFLASGELLVNEIAPRVHNSGHWTIEGSQTSQFENHIRAVTGAPLGSTGLRGYSILLNLVGDMPESSIIQHIGCAHLHLYRKSSRPRRKIGHITLNDQSQDEVCHQERILSPLLEPFLQF